MAAFTSGGQNNSARRHKANYIIMIQIRIISFRKDNKCGELCCGLEVHKSAGTSK